MSVVSPAALTLTQIGCVFSNECDGMMSSRINSASVTVPNTAAIILNLSWSVEIVLYILLSVAINNLDISNEVNSSSRWHEIAIHIFSVYIFSNVFLHYTVGANVTLFVIVRLSLDELNDFKSDWVLIMDYAYDSFVGTTESLIKAERGKILDSLFTYMDALDL